MRAVEPGKEAELHRALFQTVLQRVHRSFAREVDVAGLIAAALKTIEPLEPQSGDPADVFKKAINAALAALDPHSRYLDPRAQRSESSTITGAFGGLGLQVEMFDGLLRVVARAMPAARGLQAATSSCVSTTSPCGAWRSRPLFPDARRAQARSALMIRRGTRRMPACRWCGEPSHSGPALEHGGEVLVFRLERFAGRVGGDGEP
jgi:hypothetical protein